MEKGHHKRSSARDVGLKEALRSCVHAEIKHKKAKLAKRQLRRNMTAPPQKYFKRKCYLNSD